MKKQEEIPEGFVVVTKQIIKDNVYMGEEEVVVWGGKAEEQLSLPNDQRNPHWRNVKYKVMDTKKPAPEKIEVVIEPQGSIIETASVDIPKKRNRTV